MYSLDINNLLIDSYLHYHPTPTTGRRKWLWRRCVRTVIRAGHVNVYIVSCILSAPIIPKILRNDLQKMYYYYVESRHEYTAKKQEAQSGAYRDSAQAPCTSSQSIPGIEDANICLIGESGETKVEIVLRTSACAQWSALQNPSLCRQFRGANGTMSYKKLTAI